MKWRDSEPRFLSPPYSLPHPPPPNRPCSSCLVCGPLFTLRPVSPRPQQRPPTVAAEGEDDTRARVVDGELNYGIESARYSGTNYVAELHIRPRPSSPPGRLPPEQQHPGEALLRRLAV